LTGSIIVVFSNLEGHDRGVEDLLHALAIDLHPARLAHRHGILVPTPDRLRRNAVASHDRHDDGQAHARGTEIGLKHERQAGAAGRGIGARSGQGALPPTHRMLTFGIGNMASILPSAISSDMLDQ
jgi:hypothetical protein